MSVSSLVGTQLLFENDRIRVWDLRLEPGQSTGLHRHTTDYFYVVIGDGTLQRADADGTRHAPRRMRDGEVHFRPVGGEDIHEAINVGSTPWRNLVVELKDHRRSEAT
jgi:quercetin dioxygenase-like cupin family protein